MTGLTPQAGFLQGVYTVAALVGKCGSLGWEMWQPWLGNVATNTSAVSRVSQTSRQMKTCVCTALVCVIQGFDSSRVAHLPAAVLQARQGCDG
jgi:hypothetical protein